MLERVGVFHRFLSRYAPLGLVYTWVVVLFSWVFFRCETLASSLSFFHVLLLPGKGSGIQPGLYLDALSLTVFCVALIFATPVYPLLRSRLQTSRAIAVQGVYVVVLLAVFLLSLSQIAANTNNPFIYFRF
jgi:alginate O-acetyltransferase complex protein AlgI